MLQHKYKSIDGLLIPIGTEIGTLIETTDWSKTPLGPISKWPIELKSAFSNALASKFPIQIFWGDEKVQIYNDKMVSVIDKHPFAFGVPARVCWREIYHIIGVTMDEIFRSGVASWFDDQLLVLEAKNGFLTERYFTYSHSPIILQSEMRTGGLLSIVSETTLQYISERQLRTLNDLSALKTPQSVTEATQKLTYCLVTNPTDIPFASLYLLNEQKTELILTASVGFSDGYQLAPPVLSLSATCSNSLESSILSSIKSKEIEIVDVKDYDIPACGRWELKPFFTIVSPFLGQEVSGVLILGGNQRREWDDLYKRFSSLVTSQVCAFLSNAKTYEMERARSEKLAALDRAKTMFFENISHEFRTPLGLMLGPLDELILNSKDESILNKLDMIQRNALRLLKLVNTLLDFSRIEAGRITASFVQSDIAAITTNMASVFRSACEKEGLKYSVDCEATPGKFYIDIDMWEKIILNLISNAFKYTIHGEISISLHESNDWVFLKVKDTGIGIPEHEIPHVFNRFHRIAGNTGRSIEGTGIGLALVSELVKLHGGLISVESVVNGGSTFKVSLPSGYSHLPSKSVVHSKQPISVNSSASEYTRDPRWWLPTLGIDYDNNATVPSSSSIIQDTSIKSRILLVDDNADMREYVSKVLLSNHYQVETAVDGIDGLSKAIEHVPDLIISDIMMPRLDGLGLLKELRENPVTKGIPIIFLSARAGEESREEGLQLGADDYLTKPFTARELLARTKSHIDMSKFRADMMSQLIRANETKDHFLAVLSHELRTPLTPALIVAQDLENDPNVPRTIKDDISLIRRNIALEVRLIDDLLDLTKVTKGKLTLRIETLCVNDIINHAIKMIEHDLIEKGIDLIWDQSSYPVSYVKGDLSRLQQIMWNIFKNGVKFTPSGGKITVVTKIVDENVEIEITDTGIGIEPEVLPKVFEAFEQGKEWKQYGGLGLGLSISKVLASMHNGRLTASSPGLNKGATFTFILPITTPPGDSESTNKDIKKSNRNSISVLLVEDNKPTLMIMQRLLKRIGHNVTTATTLDEGVRKLSENNYDLVISDIGLPDGSGLHLLKRSGKKVKGIALSGFGMDQDIQNSMDAGFTKHLTKPVEIDVLSQAIDSVLNT